MQRTFSNNRGSVPKGVLDVSIANTFVDDQPVELTIHDTQGGDSAIDIDYRKQLYAKADGFIICVAADDRSSFDSVDKWENEIRLSR